MIYAPRFTIVLDANVLYPAPVRDLLLNLADLEVFAPKWSEIIQEEWLRNLLKNRPDIKRTRIMRTVQIMNEAFPDASIYGFEELIDELELPDEDDRHVLALAIASKADAILTFNTKDFPKRYIDQFNIEIYNPDRFLELLYKLNPMLVKQAFQNQLDSLKNPPKTREELIATLNKCNIKSAKNIF